MHLTVLAFQIVHRLHSMASLSYGRKEIQVNFIERNKKLINLLSGVLISVIILVLGVLFAISCYSIYSSGASRPYTYESISTAFSKVAVPVYILLFLIVALDVSLIITAGCEKKQKGLKSEKTVCENLAEKVDINSISFGESSRILKERRYRKTLGIINIVLFVLEGILPLIYLLNPANFPAENGQINTEILHGMLFYCSCLLPLLIYEVIYTILIDRSFRRESEVLKSTIKIYGVNKPSKNDDNITFVYKMRKFFKENDKHIVLGMRISFLGCAVVFIILGVTNGGMKDVLIKAINICAECIGLG